MCLLSANLPLDAFSFSSCCEETTMLCHSDSDSDSDEEKGCCESDSCECFTCHFLNVYKPAEPEQQKAFSYFFESHFSYEFQYSIDLYSSFFRPPLA